MTENSADLGGYYPPRLSASVDNTLLDLQNSSYPNQSLSIIASTIVRLYTVKRNEEKKRKKKVRVPKGGGGGPWSPGAVKFLLWSPEARSFY